MSSFKDQPQKQKSHGHYCRECLTRWNCTVKNRADCPKLDATLCESCKAKN